MPGPNAIDTLAVVPSGWVWPNDQMGCVPLGAEIVTLDLPPLPDARAAYTALGISVDKSIRLEQHDSEDGGMSAVDAWLRGMLGEAGG